MTELTPDSVAAVDRSGMLGDVLDQPGQIGDALWRFESAGVRAVEAPAGLIVCGMGGSAIGGDLAQAAIGERALRPLRVARGYDPGPGAAEALVLCASYSGNTEETLACFEAAGQAGAERLALTTGGALAEAARAAGVPVVGVPAGMRPRAAVVYMTVGALESAAACGAAPSLRGELEAASPRLAELVGRWGPDAGEESEPKRLARALRGTLPVVYGTGPLAAVARRWKTQLNENPELPAFFADLPEADHNEICAFGRGEAAPVTAVFLTAAGLDPRLARRVDLTAEAAAEAGVAVERVEVPGQSPAELVLAAVMLGDLVSIYLAALEGVDPTPMEAIDRFKARLDAGP